MLLRRDGWWWWLPGRPHRGGAAPPPPPTDGGGDGDAPPAAAAARPGSSSTQTTAGLTWRRYSRTLVLTRMERTQMVGGRRNLPSCSSLPDRSAMPQRDRRHGALAATWQPAAHQIKRHDFSDFEFVAVVVVVMLVLLRLHRPAARGSETRPNHRSWCTLPAHDHKLHASSPVARVWCGGWAGEDPGRQGFMCAGLADSRVMPQASPFIRSEAYSTRLSAGSTEIW